MLPLILFNALGHCLLEDPIDPAAAVVVRADTVEYEEAEVLNAGIVTGGVVVLPAAEVAEENRKGLFF